MYNFFLAWILTVSIETTTLQVLNTFGQIGGNRNTLKNIVFAGVVASSLTLPYLYFVFPAFFEPNSTLYICVGEISITLIEAVFYMFFFDISSKKALSISLIANLISFATGVVLFWF